MKNNRETWVGFMDDTSPPVIAFAPKLLSDGAYTTVKREVERLLALHTDRKGKTTTLPDDLKHVVFANKCKVHGVFKNNTLELFVEGMLFPDEAMLAVIPDTDISFASGIYSRAEQHGGFMVTLLDGDDPRLDKVCLLVERFDLGIVMRESDLTN